MARTPGPIDRWFGVSDAGSTIQRELRGGATTFLTMVYILFVNPDILGAAIQIEGVDQTQIAAQILTATALAAALGSALMGLLARYPFALAPAWRSAGTPRHCGTTCCGTWPGWATTSPRSSWNETSPTPLKRPRTCRRCWWGSTGKILATLSAASASSTWTKGSKSGGTGT